MRRIWEAIANALSSKYPPTHYGFGKDVPQALRGRRLGPRAHKHIPETCPCGAERCHDCGCRACWDAHRNPFYHARLEDTAYDAQGTGTQARQPA